MLSEGTVYSFKGIILKDLLSILQNTGLLFRH